MKVEELKQTHELYDNNISIWKRYKAVFEGIETIIKQGYITKHEREPQAAYDRRIEELYGLGYSKSIVKILTFFLFKTPPQRSLKELDKEEQWNMFFTDSNLMGDDFDTTMMQLAKYASIYGQIGVLLDKSPVKYQTKAQEKENKVYPYVALYHPQAILDWEIAKVINKRPYLAMVKLLNDDGTYLIWTQESWEIWEIEEDEDGNKKDASEDDAVLVQEGDNKLGFVPFFWHYNNQTDEQGVGVSDLSDIARIDISIIKNLSQVEEIIDYAAFPMMLKPRRDARPNEVMANPADDEVGVQAVQEFDPEYPETKPEWLKSEVQESVTAVLSLISKKVSEIYRSSNIGGLSATEVQTQAKSGVALQTEFQMLNAELVSKAINLEKTENKILNMWLKWQMIWEQFNEKVHMGRARTYDIENLAVELDNALTAKTLVISQKFDELVQKQISRQILPTISEDDTAQIDQEIENNVQNPMEVDILDNIPEEDEEIINGEE